MSELTYSSGLFTGMASSDRDAVSDEVLAERVRVSGDRAAFTVLVTRYRVRLVALARRMLAARSAEEAEDVAQETFVAAYEKRASFQRGQPFRPWLYRIAVNRCLDRLRVQGRHPAVLDWDKVPEPSGPESDPLDLLLASEGERLLETAVAALPPKLRAVFLLRHLDALSYDEIAAATGVPVSTVKTHLFRARTQLRAALSEYLDR
ncbi:MAG: RNA polymerase sigma factor [Janthinobacterium lividum]